MKTIYYVLGILLLVACYEDKGNYDYLTGDEVLPVKINGLEDSYENLKVLDSLKLVPDITGMDDESNYWFTWYLNSSGMSYKNTRDTVALTRDLDVAFDCEAGEYTLIYEIRDKQTNLYVSKKMNVVFSSDFAHGWFVLKDQNGETDVDFVQPDSTVRNNVISRINGRKLPGEGVKILYQAGNNYTHEVVQPDGTVKSTRMPVFHVLSSKGLNVLEANGMTLLKDFEEFFFESPAVCAPQNITLAGSRDLAFLNGGQLYQLYGLGRNVGKVGLALGDYQLEGGMVTSRNYGVMVFDAGSSSFLYSGSHTSTVMKKFNPSGSGKTVNGLGVDLIALLPRNAPSMTSAQTAYALMQKKGAEEYYLADIAFNGAAYPFASFDTLPDAYEVAKAEVFGTHPTSRCIYFASGSELKAHVVSSDNTLPVEVREMSLKEFPGETISYIAHVKSASAKDKFEHLVVLTNNGEGWKLYRFALKGSTFEIEPEPVVVYKGQGTARCAVFRV